VKALCVITSPAPDQLIREAQAKDVELFAGIPADVVQSFEFAKELIYLRPMCYDAIVTNFSSDILLDRDRFMATGGSSFTYDVANSFVSYALKMNPFSAIVIYSGASSHIARATQSSYGDRISWVDKGNDLDASRLEIAKRLLECLCEYQFVLDKADNIRVVQGASRSPFRFQPTKSVEIVVKPHLKCKRIIFPDEVMEFEYLINKKSVSESELQMFLEAHPTFLLGNRYKYLRSHVYLQRDQEGPLIPDFILEPVNPFDYWKVIDLKLPNDKITKIINDNRKGFNSKILDALHQLREYRDYFDNPVYRERMGDVGITAFKPELSVIVGRDYGNLTMEDVIKARCDLKDLEIITYEELLERVKQSFWLVG